MYFKIYIYLYQNLWQQTGAAVDTKKMVDGDDFDDELGANFAVTEIPLQIK